MTLCDVEGVAHSDKPAENNNMTLQFTSALRSFMASSSIFFPLQPSETGSDFTNRYSQPICVWQNGMKGPCVDREKPKQRWRQLLSFQFTASSWLARYSLLCQPVDYSSSPLAMRVNLFFTTLYFVQQFLAHSFVLCTQTHRLTSQNVYVCQNYSLNKACYSNKWSTVEVSKIKRIITHFSFAQMARVCWWFYFSKVIELSDTVSMKGVKRSCEELCSFLRVAFVIHSIYRNLFFFTFRTCLSVHVSPHLPCFHK